jgi:hypothetical protein
MKIYEYVCNACFEGWDLETLSIDYEPICAMCAFPLIGMAGDIEITYDRVLPEAQDS